MIPRIIPAVVRQSQIVPYYTAKAGLIITSQNITRRFVGGFSIDPDPKKAISVARGEVLERVNALYDVLCPHLHDGRQVEILKWPTLVKKGFTDLTNVVLGAHPFTEGPYLDANGLAYHPELPTAARHGLYEILERHILASIWYHQTTVIEIYPCEQIHGEFKCRLFTTLPAASAPFILALVSDSAQRVALVGSCFADTITDARNRAIKEACLLLDGVLESDRGLCSSDRSRVLSLRDPDLSQRRIAHFESRVTASVNWAAVENTSFSHRTAACILPDYTQAAIALLSKDPGFVIRAIIPGANSLSVSRYERSERIVEDWFC